MKKGKNLFLKIVIVISYLAMIVVNALANILPINNLSTGQISEMYSNLFAPAGYAFSIWGLIYLLLGAYVLYAIGVFGKKRKNNKHSSTQSLGMKNEFERKIGIWFIISSLANIAWLFSWHYNIIPLSMIFMLVLLFSLIKIWLISYKEKFSKKEFLFLSIPFTLYFGWITVATIANFTVFFVSLGFKGLGIPAIWTILVLLIGMALYLIKIEKDRDLAYSLVFIWAYLGIFVKHISEAGFNGQYLGIVLVSVACISIFITSIIIGLMKK